MTGRKNRFVRWFLVGALVASLGGLVGCGGGDDAAPLALGTFNKTVVQAGAADNVTVFDNNDTSSRIQALLYADDIDGSGYVKSLSFRFSGASTGSTIQNVTIKLGHTSIVDNLTTTFASNVVNGKGSQVTVFGPSALVVPAGADNTWFTIPLSAANKFNYNGVDDLVVEITTGTTTRAVKVTGAAAGYDALLFADNSAAPTGTIQTSLPDIKIGFAGGTSAFEFGLSGDHVPLTSNASFRKGQFLMTSKEIDGGGLITGFAFQVGFDVDPTPDLTYTGVTVRIGHTRLGSLGTGFDNNFFGAPIKVIDNATLTVPAGQPIGSYVWVPFATPFAYNGVDNLIVEVRCATGTRYLPTGVDGNYDGSTKYRLYGTDNAVTGTVDGARTSVKLRFAGGTMDVVTSGTFFDPITFVGGQDNGTIQYLYRMSELGTKGVITKVEIRLLDNSVAATYPGFTLKLGQTDNVALSASSSANTAGATTVFTGNYSIPAGLKAGDWVEIPLTAPIAYNPAKNLFVHTFKSKGAAENRTSGEASATLYANRCAYAWPVLSDALALDTPNHMDLRLTIQ